MTEARLAEDGSVVEWTPRWFPLCAGRVALLGRWYDVELWLSEEVVRLDPSNDPSEQQVQWIERWRAANSEDVAG